MSIKYDRRALRRIRLQRAITLQDLAVKAGMTPNAVGYIDRGVVDPKVSTIAKIATALEVDVREFFIVKEKAA
jgi:transcriptional regulator with XRE-family HTH domain